MNRKKSPNAQGFGGVSTYDFIFADDEDETEDPAHDKAKSHSWSAHSDFEFDLISYCIKQVVEKLDKKAYQYSSEFSCEFTYDVDKETTVPGNAITTFNYEGNNYVWRANKEQASHVVSCNGKIDKMKKIIQKYIKDNNPLRRKNIQISTKNSEFLCTFKIIPPVTFEGVILDDKLKQDIYDNTIFQIKKLKQNNGVIFYGVPGSGKSMLSQAIIHESIKEKFSSCFITTALNFSAFGEFLQKYLAPCVCIFEDVDSYGASREAGDNPILGDFLQLLSGVSEGKERIVFIATTNHIAHLDAALTNRPMRFNRKYEFGYPTNGDIDKLVDLYFPDPAITAEQKKLCYDSNLLGSHLKEIRRTCDLKKEKDGTPVNEAFDEAVKIIKLNFHGPKKPVGFQPPS